MDNENFVAAHFKLRKGIHV